MPAQPSRRLREDTDGSVLSWTTSWRRGRGGGGGKEETEKNRKRNKRGTHTHTHKRGVI